MLTKPNVSCVVTKHGYISSTSPFYWSSTWNTNIIKHFDKNWFRMYFISFHFLCVCNSFEKHKPHVAFFIKSIGNWNIIQFESWFTFHFQNQFVCQILLFELRTCIFIPAQTGCLLQWYLSDGRIYLKRLKKKYWVELKHIEFNHDSKAVF